MKKVFYQGSFDLFHYGHLVALKEAKKTAESVNGELIVGVNTDNLYKKYKKKKPIILYRYRKEIIKALRCVDRVIPCPEFSPIKILKKYNIDIYIICEEWRDTKKIEIEYMKSKGGKVIILPYYKTTKAHATDIRNKIFKNYLEHEQILCAKCHRRL